MPEHPPAARVPNCCLCSLIFVLLDLYILPMLLLYFLFFLSVLFRFFVCSNDSILFCSPLSEKCTIRERPFKATPRSKIT